MRKFFHLVKNPPTSPTPTETRAPQNSDHPPAAEPHRPIKPSSKAPEEKALQISEEDNKTITEIKGWLGIIKEGGRNKRSSYSADEAITHLGPAFQKLGNKKLLDHKHFAGKSLKELANEYFIALPLEDYNKFTHDNKNWVVDKKTVIRSSEYNDWWIRLLDVPVGKLSEDGTILLENGTIPSPIQPHTRNKHIDERDHEGNTLLHLALYDMYHTTPKDLRRQILKVVNLLDEGANPEATNKFGTSCIDIAKESFILVSQADHDKIVSGVGGENLKKHIGGSRLMVNDSSQQKKKFFEKLGIQPSTLRQLVIESQKNNKAPHHR